MLIRPEMSLLMVAIPVIEVGALDWNSGEASGTYPGIEQEISIMGGEVDIAPRRSSHSDAGWPLLALRSCGPGSCEGGQQSVPAEGGVGYPQD